MPGARAKAGHVAAILAGAVLAGAVLAGAVLAGNRWLARLSAAILCAAVACPVVAAGEPQRTESYFIGRGADYFLDRTGELTIDAVAGDARLFTTTHGKVANLGVSPSRGAALWLRIQIPDLDPALSWVVSVRESRVFDAELYIPAGAGWEKRSWNAHEDARAGRPLLRYPSLAVEAARISGRQVYLRIETTSSLRGRVWLQSSRAFAVGYADATFVIATLIGIQIGLFAYLVAIGSALRDQALLRLAALDICFVAYLVSDRAVVETMLLPGAFRLSGALALASSFLIYAAWLSFESCYLGVRGQHPRLARLASGVAALLCLLAGAAVLEAVLGVRFLRLYSAYIGLGAIGFGIALACSVAPSNPRRVAAFLICWLPAIAGGVARLSLDALPPLWSAAFVDFVYLGVAFSLLLFGLVTSFDIQRRERRLRTEAEESEARFRSFAESASDSYWETDAQGRIAYLAGLSGGAAHLAIGEGLVESLEHRTLPEGRSALLALAKALAGRRPFRSLVLTLAQPTSGRRELALSGTPVFSASGRYAGHRGTVLDVTDERLSAERRAQQQKMAALGQLAGGIAHEINNLLHPIINLGRRVRQGLRPVDEKRYQMDLVVDAAVRAREIVAGVLASARPGLEPTAVVPLREALDRAIAVVRTVLPEAVVLDVSMDDVEGPGVQAGEVLQVVSNLVSNAVHAVHGAGRVEVSLRRDLDGAAVLSVADDGEGMDPEVRGKALEPFFTTKAHGAGTGLGLAVVYGLTQGWGASLDILSERGRGTRVVIRFKGTARAERREPVDAEAEHAHPGG